MATEDRPPLDDPAEILDDLLVDEVPPFSETDLQIGALVKEITEDVSTLVRKEVELARIELLEVVRSKLLAAGLAAAALALGVLVLPFALLTLIEVLDIWLARWLAALSVTVLMIAAGAVAILFAKRRFKGKLAPKRTIESIKEDVRWLKNLKR